MIFANASNNIRAFFNESFFQQLGLRHLNTQLEDIQLLFLDSLQMSWTTLITVQSWIEPCKVLLARMWSFRQCKPTNQIRLLTHHLINRDKNPYSNSNRLIRHQSWRILSSPYSIPILTLWTAKAYVIFILILLLMLLSSYLNQNFGPSINHLGYQQIFRTRDVLHEGESSSSSLLSSTSSTTKSSPRALPGRSYKE